MKRFGFLLSLFAFTPMGWSMIKEDHQTFQHPEIELQKIARLGLGISRDEFLDKRDILKWPYLKFAKHLNIPHDSIIDEIQSSFEQAILNESIDRYMKSMPRDRRKGLKEWDMKPPILQQLKKLESAKILARHVTVNAVRRNWDYLQDTALNDKGFNAWTAMEGELVKEMSRLAFDPNSLKSTSLRNSFRFTWKWGEVLVGKDLKFVRWKLAVSYQHDDNKLMTGAENITIPPGLRAQPKSPGPNAKKEDAPPPPPPVSPQRPSSRPPSAPPDPDDEDFPDYLIE